MLKTRLHDGTPIMEYFRDLRPSFWKDSVFKNFGEFEAMIISKERPTKDSYFWIQFPKPFSLTVKQFANKIEGLERYVWFKKYTYNIEFMGSEGRHEHCHLLIDDPPDSVRPARIIANIASHLNLEKNHIECKRQSHSKNNRLNYIKGTKVCEQKMEYVRQDNTFREKYNLKVYYSDALQKETESTQEEKHQA